MKFIRFCQLCLLLLLSGICQQVYSQNGVAIAATTATADGSAMLDVQSTTKGALIPRMTNAQRSSVPSPANGLLVFCTDAPVGLYYYNTSIPAWVILSAGALTGSGSTNYDAIWTGSGTLGTGLIYNNGTKIGVGTTAPGAVAEISGAVTDVLKVTSATGGSGNHSYIDFNTYGGPGVGARIGAIDNGAYGAAIAFETNNIATVNGTATSERMRISSAGLVGIAQTNPAYPLDVTGDINTTVGFTISGAATSGNYLRGNGTNFVSSALQAGDIPAGSGNYIQNTTSVQATSNYNISGAGTIGTNLTVGGTVTVTGLITGNGGLKTNGTAYTLYGGTAEILANADNHIGGGIAVSDDGGFYDFNNGPVTFLGSTGLTIAGSTGLGSSGAYLRISALASADGPLYADANGQIQKNTACPSPYTTYTQGIVRLCIMTNGTTREWNDAEVYCNSNSGGDICTFMQITKACNAGWFENGFANYWLGDHDGDDVFIDINGSEGTNNCSLDAYNNFDGSANRTSGYGVVCCIQYVSF